MEYKKMFPLGCPMRREQLIDDIMERNESFDFDFLNKLHENKLEDLLFKIEIDSLTK